MYGRSYDGKTLRFEPSGGLWHAALVMADKETDSYWSIMTGDALAGPLEGTELEELPMGKKMQWKEWVAEHPDTLVLSVDGREHPEDPGHYDRYFASDQAPGGAEPADDRLPPKQPIYAFQRGGEKWAVAHPAVEGGAILEAGEEEVFLYRPEGAALFYSTLGWVGEFERVEGTVRHVPTGATFDAEAEAFTGGEGGGEGSVPRLEGFDTFWFHWSQTHPDTGLIEG